MCISLTKTLRLSAATHFIRLGGSELPAGYIALTPDEQTHTVCAWQRLNGLGPIDDPARLTACADEVLCDGDLIAALNLTTAEFVQWWALLADEWQCFRSAQGHDPRAWGQGILMRAQRGLFGEQPR